MIILFLLLSDDTEKTGTVRIFETSEIQPVSTWSHHRKTVSTNQQTIRNEYRIAEGHILLRSPNLVGPAEEYKGVIPELRIIVVR
jgi:hypothetical protein